MPIQRDPTGGANGAMNALDGDSSGDNHQKLTRRQIELSERWSYFKVAEHSGKGVDWEGRQVMSGPMRDGISRNGYLPPGYDVVGDALPREFRRPVAPLGIVRNIVSRFTGLLFSNRKQPRMRVPGDEDTEDYLNAQLVHGQFWSAMIQTRNYGGGTGSGCTGFRFIQGQVRFEALNPIWTTPEFAGRGTQDLVKLTIEHTYPKEEKDNEGNWKKVWYWYRRVIDTETDTVWVPVKCRKKPPEWAYIQSNTVRHNLGFVPYEWIQNLDEGDEMDGEPDCAGILDLVRAIDSLLTEVYSGTIKNCDPTLFLSSALQMGEIRKGSDNALKLDRGESASYLELNGAGARVGLEVVKEMEDRAYRLAQCVPDQVLFQNSGEKTALEIERIYSSMLERADDLREQYGPPMVRICQKLLAAIRMFTAIRQTEDGRWIRGKVYVPPKVIQQPDGDTVEVPRELGKGTICEVKWPAYFRPTLNDVETALRVATTAKDSEVMTKSSAIRYYAPFVDLDPLKELHDLKREEEAKLASEAEATGGAGGEEGADGAPAEDGGEEGVPPPEEPEAKEISPAAWKTALDAGLITLNEYRDKALGGLGAIPDGDLTLIQYKAKYAELFVANAAISSPALAAKAVGGGQPQPGEGTPGPGEPPVPPRGRPSNAPGAPSSGRSGRPPAGSKEAPSSGSDSPDEPGPSSRPESPKPPPSGPEEESKSQGGQPEEEQ